MESILNLTKTFPNFYFRNAKDVCQFQFLSGVGFDSCTDAMAGVAELGLDNTKFLYIQFCAQWYAVHLYSLEAALVVSEKYLWVKAENTPEKQTHLIRCLRQPDAVTGEKPVIPFTPRRLFGGTREWSDKLVWDLIALNDSRGAPLPYGARVWRDLESPPAGTLALQTAAPAETFAAPLRYWASPADIVRLNERERGIVVTNSMVALGACLFQNLIPVFQLNVVDAYFRVPPTKLELWREGVLAYNPFNGYRKYQRNPKTREISAPFWLNDYVRKLEWHDRTIEGKAPFKAANKGCRAWSVK